MSANRASPGTRPAPQGQTCQDINIRGWQGSEEKPQARGDPPSVRLTQRQLEVLSLLCEGLSNKLIGRHLHISFGTVKVHVGSILRELGVSSRLHAVVVARQWGLVDEYTSADPQKRVLSTSGGPPIA